MAGSKRFMLLKAAELELKITFEMTLTFRFKVPTFRLQIVYSSGEETNINVDSVILLVLCRNALSNFMCAHL